MIGKKTILLLGAILAGTGYVSKQNSSKIEFYKEIAGKAVTECVEKKSTIETIQCVKEKLVE